MREFQRPRASYEEPAVVSGSDGENKGQRCGISFIFDLKEGEVFLGTLNGLKERQKFETLVSDRSGGEVARCVFFVGMDDGFRNTKDGAEVILSAEACEYAGHKLEELKMGGGFSTPEFVRLRNLKSKGKVVDTFFVLRN